MDFLGMEKSTTSPCMYDTDNDGLEMEKKGPWTGQFLTQANNSDTDDDGLIDVMKFYSYLDHSKTPRTH